MSIVKTIHFGIQRKIVANMTTESWRAIPHVVYNYEPEAGAFIEEFRRICSLRDAGCKLTLNTLMLRVIAEGLKAAPQMNAHIHFNRRLVRGRIDVFDNIDISMPMLLPNGEMMTINLHDFGNKSLTQMSDYIADVSRRLANTHLTEAMMEVSLDNTYSALRRGHILTALGRLIGAKTGRHRVRTLTGKERQAYYAVHEGDRITKRDIEQGTVTISNVGSLYPQQRGSVGLFEIIPPQVCAFAVGAIQKRPVAYCDATGGVSLRVGTILPLCIAFDHRALDFGDIVPFLRRLDELFANPQIISEWM